MDSSEYSYKELCWKHRMLGVLRRMMGQARSHSSWITPEVKSIFGRNAWKKSCNTAYAAISNGFGNCGTFAAEMHELFQLITDWRASPQYRLSSQILAEAFTLTFPDRDANDGPIDLKNKWKEYSLVVGQLDSSGKVVGKDTISFEAPTKEQCFDSVLQAYIRQDEDGSDGNWDVELLLCTSTQENLTTDFFDFAEPLL